MNIRPLVVLHLTVASLAGAMPARADDAGDAKARFRKGVELYKEGRWRDAAAEFEAAYRLRPHGAIHFNVAQCRERLEDWPGALRSYHDYLREVPGASDRAAVRASIRRLEERLAAAGVQAIVVYTEPPAARVVVDGKERGTTPLHAVLAPGTYALALTLAGHEAVVQEVALGASASRVVDVALRPVPRAVPAPDLAARPPAEAPPALPAPPPAEAPKARRHVAAWIAAGTAVAAAAAAAYLGWSAQQDAEAIDALPAPDRAAADRRARAAESKSRASNALYAVAGGAAAVGGALFVLEGRF